MATVIRTNLFNNTLCYCSQTYQEHQIAVKNGGFAQGIDLVSCDQNGRYMQEEVLACADGVVFYAGDGDGYGNAVWILHSNNIMSGYGHMANIKVTQGQTVKAGTQLGTIGNSGHSTGIHLHFEIRKYRNANYNKTPSRATFWNADSFMSTTYFDWIDPTNYVNGINELLGSTQDVGSYIYIGVDVSSVFNPTYYSNKYPDLKSAFGTDGSKLFKHFTQYGMNEKRQAIDSFNVDIYMQNYIDLRNSFGNNYPKYYIHYCQYGIKEGRNAISLIKPTLTVASYPDYSGNDVYRVRKSYNDSKSSVGSWGKWASAYNIWNANKSSGYHVYDKNGKQLD